MKGGVLIANADSNLQFNAATADQDIDVADTAVSITNLNANTTHVMVSIDTANVRLKFGADPTSSTGHQLTPGWGATWKRETALAARFIREGGTTGKLRVSEFTH